MKTIFLVSTLMLSSIPVSFAQAEDNKPKASDENKMTTKAAKKSCKEEGKTGAELIKCMKEKKEEK